MYLFLSKNCIVLHSLVVKHLSVHSVNRHLQSSPVVHYYKQRHNKSIFQNFLGKLYITNSRS